MSAPAAPLFERLLGPSFELLPAPVQRLHRAGSRRFNGEVWVLRGNTWLAALCARVAQLPPAFEGPIAVDITRVDDGERWERWIAGRVMRSHLQVSQAQLWERLGPLRFRFRMDASADGLRWTVAETRLFGVPLPAALFRGVLAEESAEDERYRFDVRARLPLAGLLVHYRGWLDVD